MACKYQKVLVLGHCLDEGGVYSFEWSNLPDDLNLADFDLLIFDFSVLNREINFSLDKIYTYNLWNLVFNSSAEIVIIGSPERITTNNDSAFASYFSPLSLLPLSLKWSGFSGDKVSLLDPSLDFYFKRLKRWNFHFDFASEDDKYKIEEISEALRKNIDTVKIAFKAVAKNGYGRLLSSRFKFTAMEWDGGSEDVSDNQKRIDSALFLWLPPVDDDSKKMVRLLLSNIYNVEELSSKPGWVDHYTLPDIQRLNDKLTEIDLSISRLRGSRDDILHDREVHEELEGILYRRGGSRLTAGVAAALTELECRVIGPVTDKREGLRFVDPNNIKWLVSICGDEGYLAKSDIKQLDNWIKSNIMESEWSGYGAIIGNYQCHIDPQQRNPFYQKEKQDKGAVPSFKMEKILGRLGLFVLSTKEIFEAVVACREGEFDVDGFWKDMACRGRLFD